MHVSKYGHIRGLEKKVRSSVSYAKWVARNKAAVCLTCGSTADLECHHVVDLYTYVVSLWKMYGDEKPTLAHAMASHDNDLIESVTLCSKCHSKRHPGRVTPDFRGPMQTGNWTAYPRNIRPPLSHSTCNKTDSSLGLVGFQVLLSLGWYVLNGHMDSRMVTLNRRSLAKMLGKNCPGTSFNKSLDDALRVLTKLDVLNGHHRRGNMVELHLSQAYLSNLEDNPWFMPMGDLKTPRMCVLTLRWFLGTQSNRRTYRIGLDKLKTHLGMTVKDDWMAAKAVAKACKETKWAKVEISQGMCLFSLSKKGALPVYSLRSTLQDSLKEGK
jgi:hypothetical protein